MLMLPNQQNATLSRQGRELNIPGVAQKGCIGLKRKGRKSSDYLSNDAYQLGQVKGRDA
jgi:hypothetical protein